MEIKKLVVGQLGDLELRPKVILLTHGHYDHVLVATELKLAYRISVMMHQGDLPLIYRYKQAKPERFLEGGEKIDGFEVIYWGEHSPGSIGFYNAKEKIIFSGDILFANGVGTQVTSKAIAKFLALPKETLVFPGHEESFTLADWQPEGFG